MVLKNNIQPKIFNVQPSLMLYLIRQFLPKLLSLFKFHFEKFTMLLLCP